MSIPLDRLYNYIDRVSQEILGDPVIIYRFWPHGSKKLENLINLKDFFWEEKVSFPLVYCYDQEPLNFDLYENLPMAEVRPGVLHPWNLLLDKYNCFKTNNIRMLTNIYDCAIILHSEKRSDQIKKYQQNYFIPAYYWSHAVIARDWFRYTEHVKFKKQKQKMFLIYNRAWAGTREYRLRFAELIIQLGLENDCKMSISPIEPELGIHYNMHQFKNPAWRPSTVLENFFPISTAQSHYSADFEPEDYEATDIEVVLETLFDDSRLHLTEKSLRPIACGQPFILASTHLSLEYLRSYGFKTFGMIWDERYDECVDPEERLIRIADLMKQIANWDPCIREQKMTQARAIAEYNRKHFFSQEFFDKIINELHNNLKSALNELENTNTSQRFLNHFNNMSQYKELNDVITGKVENPLFPYISTNTLLKSDFWKREVLIRITDKAQKYYIRSLKKL